MAAADEKEDPKVIIVVTNHTKIPEKKQKELKKEKTGWYLPEVAHPYYHFIENNIKVVFVSPRGGGAEVDPISIVEWEKDPKCVKFVKERLEDNKLETYAISAINYKEYKAIFFAGGAGTIWDFPDDKYLQNAAAEIYENKGIVSAVCHGPSALVNIKLKNGEYLIKGKKVTGFTNSEEKASKMDDVVPFMLEDALVNHDALFVRSKDWSENVVVDGKLITGQNPASAEGVAKEIVKAMNK